MNPASKSIYYFGFYLILTGVGLLAMPNLILGMLFLPETSEVWIRVAGMLVLNIGIMYVYMAQENNRLFCLLTCYLRTSVMAWFILFVVLNWAGPILLVFGLVDLFGAIWTYSVLNKL